MGCETPTNLEQIVKRRHKKNANGPQTKADQPFIDNSNPQKTELKDLFPRVKA